MSDPKYVPWVYVQDPRSFGATEEPTWCWPADGSRFEFAASALQHRHALAIRQGLAQQDLKIKDFVEAVPELSLHRLRTVLNGNAVMRLTDVAAAARIPAQTVPGGEGLRSWLSQALEQARALPIPRATRPVKKPPKPRSLPMATEVDWIQSDEGVAFRNYVESELMSLRAWKPDFFVDGMPVEIKVREDSFTSSPRLDGFAGPEGASLRAQIPADVEDPAWWRGFSLTGTPSGDGDVAITLLPRDGDPGGDDVCPPPGEPT